jgi:hypothetical protein
VFASDHKLNSIEREKHQIRRFRMLAWRNTKGGITMPLHIIGLVGPLTGQRFPLGEASLSFGRAAASTVVLEGRQASRHHAELRHEAGGYMLYDRGSRNGTFVNGEQITAQLLQPGDLISIGDDVFSFEMPATASTSAASAPARRHPYSHKPAPTYGIRCPSCGRVIEPHHQHCPWDGALLANGQTAAVAVVAVSRKQ